MFCKHCGTENAEGAAFCKNCGTNISQATPVQAAPTYTAPVYMAPVVKVKPPLSSHPVLNVVKQIASSPLFLVAIIAFSLNLLVSLFALTNIGNSFTYMLYEVLDEFGRAVPYEVYEFIDQISDVGSAVFGVFGIIALIPSIIVCIGLWMTYGSAVSRVSDGMKTAGLTMIKVVVIIELVSYCVLLTLVDFLLIFGIVASAMSPEYIAGALVALFVILLIVVTALLVLDIVYLAKIVKSINTAKNTIITGEPSDDISGFVAVWTFVKAGALLFSLITSFLASALSMTSLICFGILMFKYKNKMSALIYNAQRSVNGVIAE